MIRVGIVTFHKGFNCGAFLQTFYLAETIKSLGHEPIVIDYESQSAKSKEFKFLFSSKHPFYFLQNLIKFTYLRF